MLLRADSAQRILSPGGKLVVPLVIDMSASGGTILAALTSAVSFGSARLSFDSLTTSGFGTLNQNSAGAGAGSVTFDWFDASGASTTHTLATMFFTATSAGTTVVSFAPSAAGSELGANLLPFLRTRSLDICIAPSVKWGDVNGDSVNAPGGDGVVNIIDAQQIARYSVGLPVANRQGVAARGDVNSDATVNIIDAQQVARYTIGLAAATRAGTPQSFLTGPVGSVTLAPNTAQSLFTGDTVQLAARARDAAAADVTACQPMIWSSTAPGVATVSSSGFVTALSAGNATITATSGSAIASISVAVTQTPLATGVTVTPPADTLQMVAPANAQPTVQLSANVTLLNSANAAVTWASADPTKATVSPTGLVTAVAATPGVSVCATSVLTPSVRGCAVVTVVPFVTGVPASLSIASINTLGGAPVGLSSVAGVVVVSFNVSPGDQQIAKIALTVNGTEVSSQPAAVPQVAFALNTAAFDAATGVVRFANGAKVIGANLYINDVPAVHATSSNPANATFTNTDGFLVKVLAAGSSPAGVLDPFGYRWNGGGAFSFAATPVLFNPRTVSSVTISLDNGVDLAHQPGALAAGACTTLLIGTATAPSGSTWIATNALTGMQLSAVNDAQSSQCRAAGQVPVVTALDSAGNPVPLVSGGVINSPALSAAGGGQSQDASLVMRVDNVPPNAPGFIPDVNGRWHGWLNDSVSFNTVWSLANPNGMLAGASADAGVGGGTATGVTYSVRVDTGHLVSRAPAGSVMTNTRALAESPNSVTYCAVVTATDVLGNTSRSAAAGAYCGAASSSLLFGVDRTAPLLTASSVAPGMQDGGSVNALDAGPHYTIAVRDTGSVAASGFRTPNPANELVVSITARPSNSTGTPVTASVSGQFPSPTVTLSGTRPGYYTTTIRVPDSAGNLSAPVSFTIYIDGDGPNPPLVTIPVQSDPAVLSGHAVTFSALAGDNGDLAEAFWTYRYGASGFVFERGHTALNGFNVAPFVNANAPFSYADALFAPLLSTVSPSDSNLISIASTLTSVDANAVDRAGNVASQHIVPTNGGLIPYPWFLYTQNQRIFVRSSADIAGTTTLSRTGATPGTARSTTLALTLTELDAESTAPLPALARIEYWISCGNGGNYVPIGAAIVSPGAGSTVDDGFTRSWMMSPQTFTPGASFGTTCGNGTKNAIAVLYKSDGGMLVTPPKPIQLVN